MRLLNQSASICQWHQSWLNWVNTNCVLAIMFFSAKQTSEIELIKSLTLPTTTQGNTFTPRSILSNHNIISGTTLPYRKNGTREQSYPAVLSPFLKGLVHVRRHGVGRLSTDPSKQRLIALTLLLHVTLRFQIRVLLVYGFLKIAFDGGLILFYWDRRLSCSRLEVIRWHQIPSSNFHCTPGSPDKTYADRFVSSFQEVGRLWRFETRIRSPRFFSPSYPCCLCRLQRIATSTPSRDGNARMTQLRKYRVLVGLSRRQNDIASTFWECCFNMIKRRCLKEKTGLWSEKMLNGVVVTTNYVIWLNSKLDDRLKYWYI